MPTLNKMKQQLHQLSVSFAQLTNEALMSWDPELEYKYHLLQEQMVTVRRNEDVLDSYDQDEVRIARVSRRLASPSAREAHSPLTPSHIALSLALAGCRGRQLRETTHSCPSGACHARPWMCRPSALRQACAHIPRQVASARMLLTAHITVWMCRPLGVQESNLRPARMQQLF